MANLKVAVYKQIRVNGASKRCPPYVNKKNHKVDSDKVLVNGKMEIHPEGDWGIYYYEGSKRQWKAIGPKYQAAREAADVKELALKGRAKGLVVEEQGEKTLLKAAIDLFLENYKDPKHKKQLELLSYDLGEFAGWVKKNYVEDITRTDLLRFKAWVMTTPEKPRSKAPHTVPKLRSERTACNKTGEVNQFLRFHFKLEPGKGLITGKDIKYTKKQVKTYDADELSRFFAKCKPVQDLIFTTFLQAGLRKQEMMYLEWDDIDAEGCVIRVREKLLGKDRNYAFHPKTGEERDVSVPKDLIDRLLAHKESSKFRLVFPTSSGKPNDKIWDMCTNIARRAGFAEGTFHVHRFRASFATHCLQNGMDLKTVQEQLGHNNIESTMRYLAGLKAQQKRDKVEAIWGTAPAVVPSVYSDILEPRREGKEVV